MREGMYTELLAPAGNPAAFYGAVSAGADAVYLGGSRFGARAYAENFTTPEAVQCIRYGHLFGKKIYLTVNTLIKEQEMKALHDYLLPFCEAGLDAVIVQDFGALRQIREWFPQLAVHASTQMTLCTSFGAQLLKDMGVSRIVPARELTLEELKAIRAETDVELETFIHGAMCYCYSGQCLFSSILGGRSGNRGRCAQPCRLPYRVRTKDGTGQEGYYLSLKDLCTVEHIPALMDAGIDSFKIEGRMKRPEYAAGVTAVYRKYMDLYLELSERFGREEAAERFRVEREDGRNLNSLYIRSEVQDGYYFKRNGAEMVTLRDPSYGKNDEALLEEIRRRYLSERKKLPVFLRAVFQTGGQARLALECGDVRTEILGDGVEAAQRQPVTEENIRRQLGKLGDSVFFLQGMEIFVSGDAFYPLKQINELRREGISRLEDKILRSMGYGTSRLNDSRELQSGDVVGCKEKDRAVKKGYCILLETGEQLQAAADWLSRHPSQELSCIYISGDLAVHAGTETMRTLEGLAERFPLLLALPYILREADRHWLQELSSLAGEGRLFTGFLIRSADGLGFLPGAEKNCLRRLDANVYTWNSAAMTQLAKGGADGFCLPLELTAVEQRRLLERITAISEKRVDFEKIVYGRIPMMVTANCLLRTEGKCHKYRKDERESKDEKGRIEGTKVILLDRCKKEFPVAANCAHCMNIIYNSIPLSLQSECSRWENRVRLRIDFTVESGDETEQILDAFLTGRLPQLPGHTTGHEKRGVE